MRARLFCSFVVLASAATLSAQTPPAGGQAAAPGGQPAAPPPMTNLQIFPTDTPRPQVIAAMQNFAQSLGVRCVYCHIDEPGKEDFASDDKKTKLTARVMMHLTTEINQTLAAEVGKPASELTRVQCVTCHRGVAIPKQLADIMMDASTTGGPPAAIAKYRELRKQYYGAMAYDFSENGLITVAQRFTQANKPDDAMAALQLNTEFFPQSSRTYFFVAQAEQRKGDTAAAVKNLEKAIELDPQNAQAKRALEQLKKN